MSFRKTLGSLLTGSLVTLMGFTGLAQTPDSIKIKKPLLGLEIIENEPNEKKYSQEEINNIKDQYKKSIKDIQNSLYSKGFSSPKNIQELTNLWHTAGESIWNQYKYDPQDWLIDGIKTKLIDCDLSAYVAGDIMNQFNLNSKIVYFPVHAILATEIPKKNETFSKYLYIETTNSTSVYETREEMREKYPIIFGEAEFNEGFPKIAKHHTNWHNYMNNREFENALEEVNKAISVSDLYWLYTNRANTNVCLNKYFNAMADLDTAKSIYPHPRKVILREAEINRSFGFYKKAIENYNELLKNHEKANFLAMKEKARFEGNSKLKGMMEKEEWAGYLSYLDELKSPEIANIFASRAKTNFEIASKLENIRKKGLEEIIFHSEKNDFGCLISKINYKDYEEEHGKDPEKEFFKKAGNDFDRAIELNPDIAYFYLGRARTSLAIRQFDPALNDLESAIQLSSKKAWKYLIEKARINIDLNTSKNLEQAIIELDRAIEKNPDKEKESLAGLYYQKALLEHKFNRNNQALQDYDKALQQYEKSPKKIVFFLESPSESGSLCIPSSFREISWKILPDNILEIFEKRGRCNYSAKNYREAINDFSKDNLEKFLKRWVKKTYPFESFLGKHRTAIEYLETMPDTIPEQKEEKYDYVLKNYKESIEDSKKILDGLNLENFSQREEDHMKSNLKGYFDKHTTAIITLDTFPDTIPEQKEEKYDYVLKNYKESIEDSKKILDGLEEFFPKEKARIYYLRSEAKRYTGDHKGAIADLDTIIENFSTRSYPLESYELYSKRARLYKNMDNHEETIANYNQAMKNFISKGDLKEKGFLLKTIGKRAWAKKALYGEKGPEEDLKILKKLRKIKKPEKIDWEYKNKLYKLCLRD